MCDSAESLAQQQCPPSSTLTLLDDEALQAGLRNVPAWSQLDGAIERLYRFRNFHQTMAFVNAVAWIAHQQDHHPELSVSYRECRVSFSTHSAKGLTINDLICAARVDALVPAV